MRDAVTALALAPVLVPQALWVMVRAARLPEADGPRSGVQGAGPVLRVLIVGDSSGAGVGVAHQDEGLAGQLVRQLAPHHRVSWRLEAQSGATVGSTLERLRDTPAAPFDVAVIALGVNDSKNGHARGRWRQGYADLVALLTARFGVRLICVSGVPPLGVFPLLPWPLRAILGRRAALFDADLRAMVAGQDALRYVDMVFPMDRDLMAEDGFHPGPAVYAEWARRVADEILERTEDAVQDR